MLNCDGAHGIFLMPGPTDMRKAINGLAQYIAANTEYCLFDGAFFIFCSRSRKNIKILYWENNGFCLWQKRLEKERFAWPSTADEALALRPQELRWLLDGLDPTALKGHTKLAYNILK